MGAQGVRCDKEGCLSSFAEHAICHLRDRDDERYGERYIIVGAWLVMDYDAMHDVKGPHGITPAITRLDIVRYYSEVLQCEVLL